jgi:aspartyl-tRNA(Asn)/glutamyl-tRNA(Gln) amidotransferase subunit A
MSEKTVMADDARATARRAEAELVACTDRGPLHGIPLGLKDLLATAGVRTSAGSKILAEVNSVAQGCLTHARRRPLHVT